MEHDRSEPLTGDPQPPNASVTDAVAGRRFVSRYESRSHIHRLHPLRLWRLLLGLGLLAFGIVNVFIPGPGGSVMILAALLLLAGESRLIARLLDRAELRFQRQIAWALRHKVLALLCASGAALVVVTTLGYLITRVR